MDTLEEYQEPEEELLIKVKQLAAWINESEHMVAFTGAGVSTSAGIPDFRGPNGVWTKRDQGITIDRNFNFDVDPTPTHMALIGLHEHGILKSLVSTNTDGLHVRSGFPLPCFQEVHGNKNVEACGKCGELYYRTFPVRHNTISCRSRITTRRCDKCSTPLRWTNVAFGQSMPDLGLDNAFALASKADISLVLGTTMQVEPAASLAFAGKKNRSHAKIILVNLQRTGTDDKCDLRIFAKCDKVMELLLKELDVEIPKYRPIQPTTPEWQSQFKQCYKFRSVPCFWFEGPYDPTTMNDEAPTYGKKAQRYLARAKNAVKATDEGEISLKKGEVVEVLKKSQNDQGTYWCYVTRVRTAKDDIETGCIWESDLEYVQPSRK